METKNFITHVWQGALSFWFFVFLTVLDAAIAMPAVVAGKNATDAINTPLLQFTAGGHVIGFAQRQVILASLDHALRMEFVGTAGVTPLATGLGMAFPDDRLATGLGQPLNVVTYPDLWPGISVEYRASERGILKTTYTVDPGADATQIRLRYNVPVRVKDDGGLEFNFSSGIISESAPLAWQEIDGHRVFIPVAFALSPVSSTNLGNGDVVSFQVGAYDSTYPLFIDPKYSWHTFYGSSGNEEGTGIAIDNSGNIYFIGQSLDGWLGDSAAEPLHPHSAGTNSDIFVVKLNNMGEYQWHTFYGSKYGDVAEGLAVDGSGNVYVVGSSAGGWLGDGAAEPLHPHSGGTDLDIFILKLNSMGEYQWHTFYGSYYYSEIGRGIAVDGSDVYIVGESDSSWKGPNDTKPKHHHSGGVNIVVVKLNSAGEYQWHTFYGISALGRAIALGSGSIYIAGTSDASWFGNEWNEEEDTIPPLHPYSGYGDIVVLKLDTKGKYLWHTFYGSSYPDIGTGIAVDGSGNVYITGYSMLTWQGVNGAKPLHEHSAPGIDDIVVLKLNSKGVYQWHTFYGSSSCHDGNPKIVVNGSGNIYIAGNSPCNWQGDNNTPPLHPISKGDGIFVLKLDSEGVYQWHTFHGNEHCWGMAIDESDEIYITGEGGGWWGDGYPDPLHAYSGNNDIFVLKLGYEPSTASCTPCAERKGEPVQTATGEYFTGPQIDISLGGILPVMFVRYYASSLKTDGNVSSSLGSNWVHNFDLRLKDVNSTSLNIVFLRGKIISFIKGNDGTWVLKSPKEILYQLKEDTYLGHFYLLDPVSNLIYHFDSYTGRLIDIRDRNENMLSLTYGQSGNLKEVSDGLGRKLSFTYDALNNLIQVSDGTRNLKYSYTNGNLTGFTDPMGNTTTYSYDTSNPHAGPLLTSITYPKGNTHHIQTYDSQARVTTQKDAYDNEYTFKYNTPLADKTTVIDPLGKSTQSVHQKQKLKTKSVDAKGKTTHINYDSNDRATSLTDRLGNTTAIAYDNNSGMPSKIQDALENAGSFTYTPQDQTFGNVMFTFYNLTKITYPDGTTETFDYDGKGNLVSRKDRAGNIWTYTYNSKGLGLTRTNPEGGTDTNTYNEDGTVATSKDSDTGVVTYDYDGLKRLIKITYPDGTFIQITYDANDRIISQTDHMGRVTKFAYDENGNITSITDQNGDTIKYDYDLMDRQIHVTDRLGRMTKTAYDALGRFASRTDPNGNEVSYVYNENGWVTGVKEAGGKEWKTGYDDAGQVISQTTPLGYVTQFERDKVGNITKVLDPLGNSTKLSYDSMGNLTSKTDSMEKTTHFTYDNLGNLKGVTLTGVGAATYKRNKLGLLTSITDLRGKEWSFVYSPMGRLSSHTDPLANQWTYSYDTRGRLLTVTYPDGESKALTYDNVGNITEIEFSGGTKLLFNYDNRDRITSAEGISFTYDKESNVIGTTDGNITFGASYDNANRLSTVTYNNNEFTVSYTYDSRNLLTKATDNLTNVTIEFVYDDDGRLISLKRSNGITTTYTYDNAGRLIAIQDGSVATQNYSLNAVGELIKISYTLPLDPAKLLKQETKTLTFNDASEINSKDYAYDKRGRLVSSPYGAFTWDPAGRLVGTGSATLEYNGLGDLRLRSEGSQKTHYYYNYAVGLKPIMAERDEAEGKFIRYYVWTPDGSLLYMIDAKDGNKVYFYHYDRVGSTLFLTDSKGEVTDSYAYTPYGVVLGHNGTNGQPFTYVGRYGVRQEGPFGLYHMRARYYDSATARFITRDPAWPNILSIMRLNPYEYVEGNPVNSGDPKGMENNKQDSWFWRAVAWYSHEGSLFDKVFGGNYKMFNTENPYFKKMAKEAEVETMGPATAQQPEVFKKLKNDLITQINKEIEELRCDYESTFGKDKAEKLLGKDVLYALKGKYISDLSKAKTIQDLKDAKETYDRKCYEAVKQELKDWAIKKAPEKLPLVGPVIEFANNIVDEAEKRMGDK